MKFPDFVKIYNAPANVSPGRFCEIAGIGTTKYYRLIAEGVIRARKAGRSTVTPVEDLFRYCRGDQAAD
ncbi:hypothetical protein XH80_14690 [Bradyrhizobium sp. CCBAU 45384]|nr:hypothetical protein [Bradyrhizobium sp. CCBAU 45384]